MRIFIVFDRAVTILEELLGRVSGVVMFLIMMLVVADVCGRYFFNAPLDGSYELITIYLLAAVFFFSLSLTFRHEHHVRVDILFRYVSGRVRAGMELLGYALSLPLFVFIFSEGVRRSWSDWASNGVIDGAYVWPTWISSALVPIGAGLLVLRLSLRLIQTGQAVFMPNSTMAKLEAEHQKLSETSEAF